MQEENLKAEVYEMDIFDLIKVFAKREELLSNLDNTRIKQINPSLCGEIVGSSELPPGTIQFGVTYQDTKKEIVKVLESNLGKPCRKLLVKGRCPECGSNRLVWEEFAGLKHLSCPACGADNIEKEDSKE